MPTKLMENKVVWLTGASSGIGKAILLELLAQNASVIASSRSILELADLQRQFPSQLLLVQADVTDLNSVLTCAKEIDAKYGYLDIAVLNAGNCIYMGVHNFDVELIKQNFAVNFFGLTNCIQACLPLLRKSKSPQLVGMSSASAYLPLPRAEGYGSSKAAISYLLKSLQAHLRREKIVVSIIYPGFVKTPLTARNDFPMPFLMTAEAAAAKIVRGIANKETEISFPRPLIWLLKFISWLPDKIRIYLVSKTVKYR
jgi:short-subunit dehydrogenase